MKNISTTQLDPNWIKINGGTCICSECKNKFKPLTNTQEGLVEADLETITTDLANFPTKVIYGICPVCGMEYIFKLVDGELYLELSEEDK